MEKRIKLLSCVAAGLAICCLWVVNAMAGAVPDTGQTKCYDDVGNESPCPAPGERFHGQDGNYSINPMSFTKLDADGNALPVSASSWFMVRDNVSGLIWEVKQDKDGVKNYDNPHDADNTYAWYDPNPATNGGYAGFPADNTDTDDFINALNVENFGGYSDWRLPTIKELDFILNLDIAPPGPCINTEFFPNTAIDMFGYVYWSSTTYAGDIKYAFFIFFSSGHGGHMGKSASEFVRAVRGGQ